MKAEDLTRTRIKVCGITNPEDAAAAVAAGVDGLGFIFAPKSPRYIEPAAAQAIINRLPPFVSTIGVFVDEQPAVVTQIARDCRLSIIQLHGKESPEYCRAMPIPVVKAFRVKPDSRSEDLVDYTGCVQAFLLDTYQTGIPGGTGLAFDWGLIEKIAPAGPIILAGGLNPENVGTAIRMIRPYAVDVSSGVESVPGRKDHDRLRHFVSEVWAVDCRLAAGKD